MRANTTILAFLAKALKGNANQEAGDTKILVPNVFSPSLHIPEIFSFFNSVPLVDPYLKSFIHTDQRLFNLNNTVDLCTVGPGLWEFEFAHWIVPEGAAADLTSNVRLQLSLIEGTNPVIDLTRFTNSLTVPQRLTGRFRATIPVEQQLLWRVNSVIGAGTGTSRSLIRIIANRFL